MTDRMGGIGWMDRMGGGVEDTENDNVGNLSEIASRYR